MKTPSTILPNTTPLPHIIIREWMPRLSDVELRVLLVVVDQTLGWVIDDGTGRRKAEDWISSSQLCAKTGRSRKHISRAVGALVEEHRIVEAVDSKGRLLDTAEKRQAKFGKIFYRLSLHEPEATLFDKKALNGAISSRASKGLTDGVDGTKRRTQKGRTTKESSLTKEKTPGPQAAPEDQESGKIPLTALGADVLKAFEAVDAKNKTYYSRRPQREACEFLLAEYGMERVLKVISGLPMTNKMPYFPSITTPLQLKEKWVALHDKVAQFRAEKKGKAPLVV